jgi:hypothetical protein
MSDEQNKFQVEITDAVSPTIAPKIDAIGNSAKVAHANVEKLKIELSSLNASGAAGLKAQVDSSQGATAKLNQELKNIAVSNKEAVSSSQQLSGALNASSSSSIRLAEITNQLSQAKKNLNTATRNLAQSEKDLTGANGVQSSQSRAIIDGYRQQQQTAGALVDRLTAAKKEASAFGKVQDDVGKSAHGSVTGVMAASGAIRALEGNFGTNLRAGERFLVNILKLGPALQAAFPIVGAVALIGILDILVTHVDKLREHLRNLGTDAQDAELKLLHLGEVRLKGEHGTNTSLFNILSGRENAPDLELKEPGIATQEIRAQLQLRDAVARVNEANKTGIELRQEQYKNDLKLRDATLEALGKELKLRKDIEDKLAEKVKLKPDTPALVSVFGPIVGGALSHAQSNAQVVPKIPVDSEQFKDLVQQAKQYDSTIKDLTDDYNLLVQAKIPSALNKRDLAEAKDGLKQAREQLKLFKEEFGKKEAEKGVFSPQDRLALLKNQLERALPENKPELQGRVGIAQEAVDRQAQTLELIKKNINDQTAAIGLYSEALRAKHEIDKIDNELLRNGIVLKKEDKQAIDDQITSNINAIRYDRELSKTFEEFNGPLKNYKAGVEAVADLLIQNAISAGQAVIANNQLRESYLDSQDPLREYGIGLEHQIELFGKVGDALTIASEIQRIQNDLRLKGRSLTESESAAITKQLTKIEEQRRVQQELNKLYTESVGEQLKLLAAATALENARRRGLISADKERAELVKIRVQLAGLRIDSGKFGGKDILTTVFGSYAKNKTYAAQITDLWKGTFETIADGAANSLGRAIVYGENLGESLKNVAREALSELISGMIKLGIQMLITQIIGKTAGAAAAATSMAEAAALASAWAAPAIEADIATLGGASAAADIAFGTSLGLAQGLAVASSALHFNKGGLVPGSGLGDSVPAVLTPGEFVLKTSAVRAIGLPTLQALNGNASSVQGQSSVGGGKGVTINIEHDGSTAVHAKHVSRDEIKIIARNEAESAVEQHAPRVVANDLHNPNSRTSKAVERNTTAGRRR